MKNWIEQWHLSNDMNTRQGLPAQSREHRAMAAVHKTMAEADVPANAPDDLHERIMRDVSREEEAEPATLENSVTWSPVLAYAVGVLLLASLVVALLDWRSPDDASTIAQTTGEPVTPSAFQHSSESKSAPKSSSMFSEIDHSLTSAYTAELDSLGRDLASAEAFLRRQIGVFDTSGDQG